MKKKKQTISRAKFLGFLLISFAAIPAFGQDVSGYSDYLKANDDSRLISLATQINPNIYLRDNTDMKAHGNTTPTVVITDVESIPLLYTDRADFGNIELLKIRIDTPAEEAAKLDIKQLTAFSNLKYVLFEYQYNSCGDNKDTCLQAKTVNKVNIPAGSTVKVFYLLSIPE